jgi:hypothetical protein
MMKDYSVMFSKTYFVQADNEAAAEEMARAMFVDEDPLVDEYDITTDED